MRQQRFEHIAGNGRRLLMLAVNFKKMLDQQRDVFCAIPQWRQMNGDDMDPVEEIFPHPSFADRHLEIPVGGRF